MKNLLFAIISLIALALFSCNTEMKTPVDSQNVIVLAADADSLTLEAAQTLQDWWVRMSGKTLAINEEPDAKKQNILLGKEYASEEQKETISELSEDGFIIAPAEHGVFLGGKTSRGDIYSATTFLEQYLGCMLLAPGEYDAPKMNEITLPQVSLKSYNPDFDFRRTLFPGQHDREYRNWYKLEQLDDWGMFVHTFHKLLPPETYFEEHPEYYSEIGGRRLQDAQLCLSNPEVIDLLIENLGKEMEKHHRTMPITIVSVNAVRNCMRNMAPIRVHTYTWPMRLLALILTKLSLHWPTHLKTSNPIPT